MNPDEFLEHHSEKIEKRENGCWVWTGAANSSGYGRGWDPDEERVRYVHRAIVEEIPDEKQVNHTCHNRLCCNPDHVYIGTQADNVRDSMDIGSHEVHTENLESGGISDVDGAMEKAWESNRVLTDSQTLEIQDEYESTDKTQRELAEEYSVSTTAVNNAIHRDVR